MHSLRVFFLGLMLVLLAPSPSQAEDGFLNQSIELTGDWHWWRSLGPMYVGNYPWVYHMEHGWLFLSPTERAQVYAWSPDLGWLWLNLDLYPWMHSSERGWMYHQEPEVGAESGFYSSQLNTTLLRVGSWMLPTFDTRLEALPVSRYSQSGLAEPVPDLERAPSEADWATLEATLPQLDGLDLDATQEAMQAHLGQVQEHLASVLALSPLLSDAYDRSDYPRTEAGFRLLLSDLGAAAHAGTLGLHRSLTLLEQFDAQWGPWIERVYLVSDALDVMDQRLFHQREQLWENHVSPLRRLCDQVIDRIHGIRHSNADAITDFEPWQISVATQSALLADATQSQRAYNFLTEHHASMERFEAAHRVVVGGESGGISGHYEQLREQMDDATEVVNALSALYWEVWTQLKQEGPYRITSGGWSGGGSYGLVALAVGGYDRTLIGEYSQRLSDINSLFSQLDDSLGAIYLHSQPLLRVENSEPLFNQASQLHNAARQVEAINALLALPVPEPEYGSGLDNIIYIGDFEFIDTSLTSVRPILVE